MSCRVTVDAEVSSDLLDFASTGEWEDAFVYHHGYLFEFLLRSKGVGNLMKIPVALV